MFELCDSLITSNFANLLSLTTPTQERKTKHKYCVPGFLGLKNIFLWFHRVNKAEFQVNKSQTNQKTQDTLLYVIHIENKAKYQLQYFSKKILTL